MGRRYEVPATAPDGREVTLVLARTWTETDAIYCEGCDGFLTGNQWWGIDKVKGMHERPGHKVRRLREVTP